MDKEHDHALLEQFFKEIAELTINHDVVKGVACVTADVLGDTLKKVDPEWYINPEWIYVEDEESLEMKADA